MRGLGAGLTSIEVELGAGDATIDASALDASAEVDVEWGVGRAEVVVPAGITVEVDAEQGVGKIDADGFTASDGLLVRREIPIRARCCPSACVAGSGSSTSS